MSATFGFGEPHDVACAEVATHTVHTHIYICININIYIYIYLKTTVSPWDHEPGAPFLGHENVPCGVMNGEPLHHWKKEILAAGHFHTGYILKSKRWAARQMLTPSVGKKSNDLSKVAIQTPYLDLNTRAIWEPGEAGSLAWAANIALKTRRKAARSLKGASDLAFSWSTTHLQ